LVLFDLQEYSKVLNELSQINYQVPYLINIHALTLFAAYKTEEYKIAEESCKYIIENEVKYKERTVNSAKLVSLLIKRNQGSLSDEEIMQLELLKSIDIDPILKKELN